MTQLTIELPDPIAGYLEAQVASGRSRSVSEFVESVLDRQRERDSIEERVLAADRANQATPVSPQFWSSMRELAQRTAGNS
ncbi:MAG: type II toxin-antitoxin system ParD family antitoxin [Planctomycetaceae bacterium]